MNWKNISANWTYSASMPSPVVAPIVNWVQALAPQETGIIFLGGPAGIGRTTALGQISSALEGAALVPGAALGNIRHITADVLLREAASSLRTAAGLPSAGGDPSLTAVQRWGEAARARPRSRPVFVILDALERVPEDRLPEVADALAVMVETATIIASAPWSVAFGAVPPLTRFPEQRVLMYPDDTLPLLPSILERRVGAISDEVMPVVTRAAIYSDGVPRVFLQLLAGAAAYARLRGRSEPEFDDLLSAVQAHDDSLSRCLLPGDLEFLQNVPNGRTAPASLSLLDVDPKIRTRLLSHGILLPRKLHDSTGRVADKTVVVPCTLVLNAPWFRGA